MYTAEDTQLKINVIVPVYRGVEETTRCLNSLFASNLPRECIVTIIGDASIDHEMWDAIQHYSSFRNTQVFKNEKNLGFVGSVNLGLSMHLDHDVVLLNNHTEVPVDFLQRLHACVYSENNIGTATPFSNSATICGYPKVCMDNALPEGYSISMLDALFREVNSQDVIDLPTAVKFCMYIRRDCLNQTGFFDADDFGRDCSEENDFCLRATNQGWRHVLCSNLFVFHHEAEKFTSEQNIRAQNAPNFLPDRTRKHPITVPKHIEQDKAKHLRHRVDLLRLQQSSKPIILFISHRVGGGVLKHEYELLSLFGDRINFLRLTPSLSNQVEIAWFNNNEALRLYFSLPTDWSELVAFLISISISRIHIHHLMDMPPEIENLPAALNIPFDITVHDYFFICPRVTLTDIKSNYCGEPSISGCTSCLKSAPSHQRDISAWRSRFGKILFRADRVFIPSNDTAMRIKRYFALDNIIVAPHADLMGRDIPIPSPIKINHNNHKLRVVVLGGLSAIKGADILEATAIDAHKNDIPIDFHLIGHAWRKLAVTPHSKLTIAGEYQDEHLLDLIREAKPDLIWFLARCPETYSYTLSVALASGIPIVATDLGAFAERLTNRPWSWICPWNLSPAEWNSFFLRLRTEHFLTGVPPRRVLEPNIQNNLTWVDEYIRSSVRNNSVTRDHRESALRFSNNHSASRLSFYQQAVVSTKRILLRMALASRSLPFISILVRHTPLTLQNRIGSWLSK
jgi:O-antigen biosynthesis protein